jgi:uncharacterized hydrophobic protein (TIGR00271 family)
MKRMMPGRWMRSVFSSPDVVDQDARDEMIRSLRGGAWLGVDYVALLLASCAIATLGLVENSAAVIIGAMIIAPLMAVIQAIAFGALEGDAKIFWRAATTLALGILTAVALSALLARSIGFLGFGNEILSRVRPNLLDLGIALAAGAIGGFARTRPSIANSLAGTAIAVALMPPLCVVGIGIAAGNWQISRGAALLFTTNLLGIMLASMIVFFLAGFARRHVTAALGWTAALAVLIVVPLGLSFRELIRETALENALRAALTHQTVTFRQATLVSSQFDWLIHPPIVTLLVRSDQRLSPHQVALLQAFARRVTGQPFQLIVDMSLTQRVTAAAHQPDDPSQSASSAPLNAPATDATCVTEQSPDCLPVEVPTSH